MDILSYVAQLIQTHKEVGILQVGTFFKKKSPGRYDAERHAFLPPSYSLNFKEELTEETSLAGYISQQHNLSSESARYHIDKFAEALKQQLAEQQQVDLAPLGKLALVNDALQFEANPELNLGYEFYGLPPVHEQNIVNPAAEMATVGISDAEKLEAIIIENEIEEENPGTLPEEPIFKVELPEETAESEPETTKVNVTDAPAFYNQEQKSYPVEELKRGLPAYVKLTIVILVLLIATLALFLVKPDLKDRLLNVDQKQATSQPVETIPQVVPAVDSLAQQDNTTDTIVNNTTVPADQLTKDSVAVKVTAPALKGAAANQPITFEVIGSSVYGEKEAANFIAAMKKKWGINAKIVSQRPGKKIKISIATYKDEKTARAERNRLEEKIKIPGLYIYVNTHKPE